MIDLTIAQESPMSQIITEEVIYTLDTTNYGGSPTSPTCTLFDLTTWLDVSSTSLSGSPSINANYIVSPVVKSLSRGHNYELVWLATYGGAKLACKLIIMVK